MKTTTIKVGQRTFKPIKGLDGPFDFSGRILYFDPKEQLHYDSVSDYYVYPDEMAAMHQQIFDILCRNVA